MKISNKALTCLFVLTLTSFTGCFNFGGGSTNPTVTTSDQTRKIDDPKYAFTAIIPREWDIIEAKDFTKDVPQETQLVLRNNVKNEDFTANVNVVHHVLQTTRETLEYAKQVINAEKTGLYNYQESKRDTFQIPIADKKADTYVTYFVGAKEPSSDVITFIQTFAVKGTDAYIITGSYSPKESQINVKAVESIVKSFILK
ncbi:MAG: hypothetical protein WC843_01455 [Candidatus Gracilibacteria bacterium]|jgi:hypothetical protein